MVIGRNPRGLGLDIAAAQLVLVRKNPIAVNHRKWRLPLSLSSAKSRSSDARRPRRRVIRSEPKAFGQRLTRFQQVARPLVGKTPSFRPFGGGRPLAHEPMRSTLSFWRAPNDGARACLYSINPMCNPMPTCYLRGLVCHRREASG